MQRRPSGQGASAATLFLMLGALLAGCGSTRTFEPNPGIYDRVPEAWLGTLTEARSSFEGGEARTAHDLVRPLAAQRPHVLPVRIFLQELQLALLSRGEGVGGFEVPTGVDPGAVLGDLYLERADANPSVAGYVLAARFQGSGEAALAALQNAEREDPRCVWVHYARAWWNARLRLFPEARAAVEEAFALDEGHLPTMRLHASLQAGAGETAEALRVLALWLERTEGNPLIDPSDREEGKVDLAALYLFEEEPEEALALLAPLKRSALRDPARAELVRAVALEDLDQRALALSAARRARELAPDELMPLVLQAMLLGFEGNRTQERQVWELLLEVARAETEREEAEGEFDFADLLIRLRANTRLQRLNARRERRAARGIIEP